MAIGLKGEGKREDTGEWAVDASVDWAVIIRDFWHGLNWPMVEVASVHLSR